MPATEPGPRASDLPRAAGKASVDHARRAHPRRRWPLVVAAVALVAALGGAAAAALPWWRDGHLPPARARIAAGAAHTCAVVGTGGVRCWGDNSFGQLGNGTTTPSTSPVDVAGLSSGVVAVSGSGNHTCALTDTGAVRCWGDNSTGQLGDGTTVSSAVPVDVSGLDAGVLQVSAGAGHTCALTGQRAVACWGDNGTGQLGTGDTRPSATPVPVRDLPARSTSVGVGNGFTCAVFTGRTVRCWGDNGEGQLGLGDRAGRTRWEPVTALARSSAIGVGDSHACAVTRTGEVACWGANWAGQLGLVLASEGSLTPVGVPGLPAGVSAVSSGYHATCALASGTVTCWGAAVDAASGERAAPRAMTGLEGVEQVAVGAFHACAATAGSVSCWGENASGQLGDGTTDASDVPVVVVGP